MIFKGKTILVTGGTGSFGKIFVRRVLTGEMGTPKKVIVIHGDYSRCIELASSIYQQYRIETVAPKNLETIRLR